MTLNLFSNSFQSLAPIRNLIFREAFVDSWLVIIMLTSCQPSIMVIGYARN